MPPRSPNPMPESFPDRAHAILLKSGPMFLRDFAEIIGAPRVVVYRWMLILVERHAVERVGVGDRCMWRALAEEPPMRPHTIKRKVVDLLRARPGLRADEVAAALELPARRARYALYHAAHIGDLVCVRGKVSTWYVAGTEPAHAIGAGPCLVPGRGVKRDCANYEACLFRYVARHPREAEGPARCKPGCSAFKPFPHHVDLLAATQRRFDRTDAT